MKGKAMNRIVVVISCSNYESLGSRCGILAHLTDPGKARARQFAINNAALLKGCTLLASSPMIRTQETMREIVSELGVFKLVDNLLITRKLSAKKRKFYCSDDGTRPIFKSSSLAKRNHATAVEEGFRVFRHGIINRILLTMDEDSHSLALAICDDGLTDFLLAHAKEVLGDGDAFDHIEDLGPCDGMVLTFTGEKLVDLKEIRNAS